MNAGAGNDILGAPPDQEEWQIAETWTKFLYPFLFTRHLKSEVESCGMDFAEVLLSDPTAQGVWVETAFDPKELENMLPYVKQYLKLSRNHRRFEVEADCLKPHSIYTFPSISTNEPLCFQIVHVVLHVFFNGVACLAIEVQPTCSDGTSLRVEQVEQINAQLASLVNGTPFRLRSDPSTVHQKHPWSIVEICRKRQEITIKILIDELLQSLYLDTRIASVTPMTDRFLPIYGAMLLRPARHSSIDRLDEQFFDFAQHHLTILRKTFTPNNISTFSQIHLEESGHHYMPYHNVIHSQSLDGGFILAYDNGLAHFVGQHAPAMESFRTSYFYMMLIPFHQRLSILRYAMAAANAGLSPERGTQLRKLREEIYDFTSRCYFSQASMSEERDRIYHRWQEEFHVVQMYNELKEEIHDIDNYLADLERERENELKNLGLQRDSRNMQLFGLITLVFLPVTILVQSIPAIPILNRWINFSEYPLRSIVIVGSMIAFVAFLLAFIFRYLKRGRRIIRPFK